MIYTFGDSHAYYSFAGIDHVVRHFLGPITMRRIATGRTRKDRSFEVVFDEVSIEHVPDTLLEDSLRAAPLTPADTVIVSCGEGDVRCFLKPRLVIDQTTAEVYLPWLVDGYATHLAALSEAARGAQLAALSVPPPALYARSWDLRWPPSQLNLPPSGTDAERAGYTRLLNQLLRDACAAHGLRYVDLYSRYLDKDGMLAVELSDGGVHVGDVAGVRAALAELGLA